MHFRIFDIWLNFGNLKTVKQLRVAKEFKVVLEQVFLRFSPFFQNLPITGKSLSKV
jgi:hypothetical protein